MNKFKQIFVSVISVLIVAILLTSVWAVNVTNVQAAPKPTKTPTLTPTATTPPLPASNYYVSVSGNDVNLVHWLHPGVIFNMHGSCRTRKHSQCTDGRI